MGIACAPRPLRAAELYTLNVSGPGNLLRVDAANGIATPLATESLGEGSWNGLSSSPTNSNILFAVNNPRPATLDDPQFSRLARIDLAGGTANLFPFFDTDVLGHTDVFSSALAISSLEPGVAVVAGFDGEFPPNRILWKVDLSNGEALGRAVPTQDSTGLESLTYSLDGTTLFGADTDGRLVKVDAETGGITAVGDPGLSNFISGLAFRPDDGTLFAIDAFRADRLVTLDHLTGEFLSEVGPLGITGPEGLAFAPEPLATGLLMWGVVLGTGFFRRRMGSAQSRLAPVEP